jgi:Lrp/AsnC family transcriptional regulator, regulator for asnA, asnC and gidA
MSKSTAAEKRKKLDPIDCRMIQLLQNDGRLSNTAIAKELGIAEATVRTRLKRLINDKVIKIVAVGDPFKLGFQIIGNLKIRIDITKKDMVLEKLKPIKSLQYVAVTTGFSDIDAEFKVKSLQELNHLLFEVINKIDGVNRTETSLIMEIAKNEYDWGTAFD